MARTTSTAVKAILNEDYDSANKPTLAGYVETASALVDDVVTCASRKGLTVSSAKAELIERWLAAHFYVCSDQTYAQKMTTANSGARFHGETGMYLESSRYGQAAVSLDSTGCLAAIANGKGARASLHWLGKRRSEQTDYVDRD